MSISAKVDSELGVAFLIVEDPWSLDEFRDALGLMSKDPSFDEAMGVVVDFARVTTVPASADIEQFMAYLGGQDDRRNVKRAILVDSDLQYGMARMGAAYAEHYALRVQVYRELDEALAWLRDQP